MFNRMTNCSFTGKSPPKIHSIKFCPKTGFHFKMNNNETHHTESAPPVPNNILNQAYLDAFTNSAEFDIANRLFPEGPKRLESVGDLHFIAAIDEHRNVDDGVLMPTQVLPHNFKMPPQIDCLSSTQTDKSLADLKALLASWEMLQMYDWFAGTYIEYAICIFVRICLRPVSNLIPLELNLNHLQRTNCLSMCSVSWT